MQKSFLAAFLILGLGSLEAMGKPSVQVQVSVGEDYGWHGPDWYYGYYFSNREDYIAWREGRVPYYGGNYQEVWIGPGWYGGFWYGNERDWRYNHHRREYNRHYRRHNHDDRGHRH